MHHASAYSLVYLAFVSLPIVYMLCVIDVPNTTRASAFYLMGIQHLLSLASFAMLISMGESMMRSLVALYSHCGAGESAKLYYTAAKKEMEEEGPRNQAMQSAFMEVCANMNVMLKKYPTAGSSVGAKKSGDYNCDDSDSSRSVALTV
jgi:hypothetical protein